MMENEHLYANTTAKLYFTFSEWESSNIFIADRLLGYGHYLKLHLVSLIETQYFMIYNAFAFLLKRALSLTASSLIDCFFFCLE